MVEKVPLAPRLHTIRASIDWIADRIPVLFIGVLSDLYFVLPLMAASSLRGSHEKGYCPIDSCPIDRAGMLGRYG
jgi:hypothetical protein